MVSRAAAPENPGVYSPPRQMPVRERTASPTPATIPGQYSPPRNAPTAETYTSMIAPNPDAPVPRRMNSVQQQQPNQQPPPLLQAQQNFSHRAKQQQDSVDSTDRNLMTPANEDFQTPMEQPGKMLGANTSQLPQRPVDSGLGSSPELSQKNDSLARELESANSKNAWYASELALAQKAGYRSGATDSPVESRSPQALTDDDRPLMEALLKMRNELVSVQESFNKQQNSAAEKIAQAERQRDAAVSEAVYHKTRLAGRAGNEPRDIDDRTHESSRRLATALASQTELQSRIKSLTAEIESERKARQLAEESADIAHSRAADLDTHKQESSSELERLRSELHDAETSAREEAANSSEHESNLRMLQVDKNELTGQLTIVQEEANSHRSILNTLRDAVNSSTEKSAMFERQLDHERQQRDSVEEKLAQLKSEHESRVSELDTTSRRLQDAEELAARHAAEARTHREAVMAGFGNVTSRDINPQAVNDERVAILQERLEAANAMVRKNQEAADHASERVRRAEERIAGLEAYQEQASREGLSMRKQLQTASREAVALQSEKAEIQQQLSGEKMDSNALSVQHNALKDLLSERGIDASNPASASRGMGGQQPDSATSERLRDLESQLESSRQQHEDLRASFSQRESDANRGWEDKLKALDDDYQAAVKYLKGTEKMLSKMKQELHRYKSANKDLDDELVRERSAKSSPQPPAGWETERTTLRNELEHLQNRVTQSQQQLESQMAEARTAASERATAQRAADDAKRSLDEAQRTSHAETEQLRATNSSLESRAQEAERRVQTLLDTVGESVASYRRNSQQVNGLGGAGMGAGPNESPERTVSPGSHGHGHGPPGNISGGGLFSNSGPNHGMSNSMRHNRGLSTSSLGAESNYSVPDSSGLGGHGSGGGSFGGGVGSGSSSGPYSRGGLDGSGDNGRNSLALDSLASELETLRSHWETTNKNYRSSGQSFVGAGHSNAPSARTNDTANPSAAPIGSGIERDQDSGREGMGTPQIPGAFNPPALGQVQTGTPTSAERAESLADWRRRLDA